MAALLLSVPPPGKPVMIITEFMENGSLDTFLKVSHGAAAAPRTLASVIAQCVITASIITPVGVLIAFYAVL